MSGFVSVRSSARVGAVVCRALSSGWVWAARPLPAGGRAAGFTPAPACLFVPFGSFALASGFARSVSSLGWRVWVRPGSSGSPIFSACGLAVPAFAVKVALPAGCSVYSACSVLPAIPVLSSLAFAL
ncbi:MAG: hypothetical protein IBX55_10760 [Methyloprofundus sp.]|nr:hypothetical protein [Methyloprofundus sp.]